jgi:hypothetical protein
MNDAVNYYQEAIRSLQIYRARMEMHKRNPFAARLLVWYDLQLADARARLHQAYIERAEQIRGRAAELGLRTWERGDAPQWEPAERRGPGAE